MEFESLKIIEPILRALEHKGYEEPTPIQEQTIPLLLENKDVIGIAQTGTGKTAAFVVPILQKLHEKMISSKAKMPRALILAPTRELVAQIDESFKTYGKFLNIRHLAIYGGVSAVPQIQGLQRGIEVVIATPGRLLDLMNQRKVDLAEVEILVLDEADRMLDMGFLRDIKKIVSALPRNRQSLFFSATMSSPISKLTKDFLNNPVRMEITPESTDVEKIEQAVFFVDKGDKNSLLLSLIEKKKMQCILIFVAAKHKADRLSKMLSQRGITSDSIHGNKSQSQRMKALNNFKIGRVQALVATDIAARGIDVHNISHVINYDLPNEPENYIHRIGRTARAGNSGVAYSFCEAQDRNFLHEIERITNTKTKEADHKYHSLTAKNAVGAAAKPRPRGQGRRPSFGGNNRRSQGNGRNFRSDRKPSSNSGGRSYGNRRPNSSSKSNLGGRNFRRSDARSDSSGERSNGRSDRSRPRPGGRRVPARRPERNPGWTRARR